MIKQGNVKEISRMIARMGNEIKKLIRECMELSYFSKGSIPYQDVLQMSAAEREIAIEFVNERIEIEAKRRQF